MKQFILIAFYIFISLGIQAKNKLVIVVNPKTCRYCLHTIKGTNILDSVIAKTLYFKTDINQEQLDYFIKSNFPKTFTNYTVIQNDSLVDFYNAFDSNYIVKGMGAIVSDSNKILSHFNLDYIHNYIPQINWLCKKNKVHVSIKEVPEIRPLIDFYHISKSPTYTVISGYDESMFVYDKNLKLVKKINFNNDSICTWFYHKLHKTDAFLKYSLHLRQKMKSYGFLTNQLHNNKVIFPFVHDSVYIEYDTGYCPPAYFVGTYFIDKDSFAIDRLIRLPNKENYLSVEYLTALSDNEFRFKINAVEKRENQLVFAKYKKVKGNFIFNGFEKQTINTTLPKNTTDYPYNVFVNDECVIQYKNLTFQSIKENKKVVLKCTDFEDGKKRHSSIFDCTYNNNIIKLTAIIDNNLIQYFFNLNGDLIYQNFYPLGDGIFSISSNTATLNNQYNFINKANQLVSILLYE